MVETNRKQEIRQKLTGWLWWAAFITSVILTLAALPGYAKHLRELELSSGFATIQQVGIWSGTLLSVGSAILCLALALLVFLKRPGEPMAIFLSFFLLFYGIVLEGPLERFVFYWFPQSAKLVLGFQAILFPIVLLALLLVFPNGRFIPRWTRWLMVLSFLLTVYELLTLSLDEWVRINTTRAQAGFAVMGALLLLAMGIQFYRYSRVYGLTERQQTKWVLIGLAAMFPLLIIDWFPYYYLLNLPLGAPQPWWKPLGSAVYSFSLMILPVSLTIAILRYRLFDIDLLIRRTLVYGALTVTLVGVYLVAVLLLQQVFVRLTGQKSPVAIVISTLAIAALFTPLRNRIQNDIDRRFFRKKYDAQKTLESFAVSVRDEVELEDLTGRLLAVVEETMQPEYVSLWLKQAAGERPLSPFTSVQEHTS